MAHLLMHLVDIELDYFLSSLDRGDDHWWWFGQDAFHLLWEESVCHEHAFAIGIHCLESDLGLVEYSCAVFL